MRRCPVSPLGFPLRLFGFGNNQETVSLLPPNVSPAGVFSRDVAKREAREAHHRLTCVLLHTRPFAASHVLCVVEKRVRVTFQRSLGHRTRSSTSSGASSAMDSAVEVSALVAFALISGSAFLVTDDSKVRGSRGALRSHTCCHPPPCRRPSLRLRLRHCG